MAAMANSTRNCRIGSSILYGTGRSPLVLATEARDLDELSNGRLVLGIGNGTKRMMSDWHGVSDTSAPALRMEELVPLVRRIWNLHDGPVHHDGRFYTMHLTPTGDVEPPQRRIPIITAGVRPGCAKRPGGWPTVWPGTPVHHHLRRGDRPARYRQGCRAHRPRPQ